MSCEHCELTNKERFEFGETGEPFRTPGGARVFVLRNTSGFMEGKTGLYVASMGARLFFEVPRCPWCGGELGGAK